MLQVISDEGSDSSGSSVVARRRRLPALRDSDSDTSGWATDHSDAPQTSTALNVPKNASGFASDSSGGTSDKCSICLLRFKEQEVGTPENCEHIFCLDCITEWSTNVNTCPVDRITFNSIIVRTCAGGRVLRTDPVKVAGRRSSIEMFITEDPTVCEVSEVFDAGAIFLKYVLYILFIICRYVEVLRMMNICCCVTHAIWAITCSVYHHQ